MTNKDTILYKLKSNKPEFIKFGLKDIGLFGSYVRNEQSSKSDIDILVDFEPNQESFDNFMAIYDLIEILFKNEAIEVVTKNGLSPYMSSQILNEVQYV